MELVRVLLPESHVSRFKPIAVVELVSITFHVRIIVKPGLVSVPVD